MKPLYDLFQIQNFACSAFQSTLCKSFKGPKFDPSHIIGRRGGVPRMDLAFSTENGTSLLTLALESSATHFNTLKGRFACAKHFKIFQVDMFQISSYGSCKPSWCSSRRHSTQCFQAGRTSCRRGRSLTQKTYAVGWVSVKAVKQGHRLEEESLIKPQLQSQPKF